MRHQRQFNEQYNVRTFIMETHKMPPTIGATYNAALALLEKIRAEILDEVAQCAGDEITGRHVADIEQVLIDAGRLPCPK